MSMRKSAIIGAACGWGAQLHATQNGPQMLISCALLNSPWRRVIYPELRYPALKTLNYEERLTQITMFNKRLGNEVKETLQEGVRPIVIGGDHSAAIGIWSAVSTQVDGDLGLIWLDAHMDGHTIDTTPSKAIHGMPVAVLLGHGEKSLVALCEGTAAVKPENMILIGVRNFEEGEAELLKRLNVRIYYIEEVKKRGFKAVMDEAVKDLKERTVGFGISLDLDVFDPEVAPGVGSPAPDGLYADEVLETFSQLKDEASLLALEIAEFNPERDVDNQTSKLIESVVGQIGSSPREHSPSEEWISNEEKHLAPNYHPIPVVLTRGEGVWLWDIEGKRYLDMMSAYSAVSFGHANPRLVEVLHEQAKTLSLTSRAFHTDTLAPFVDKLCEISGMDKAMILNSGVEAVEAGKGARKWGYENKGIADGKAEIIVCAGNFHGRTTTVISFSSDALYKDNFGPFTPGFVEIPYNDAGALRKAITPNTCAFLVEPMQGEAGIVMPSRGWLKECEKICRENNVLLILDEIQTGLGRTGAMFAFEHENVKPDGLILGKGLGGGLLPVSAFLARSDVMDLFAPGTHGSTFGGNPLASRVGYEALCMFEDGALVENSKRLGAQLLNGIKNMNCPFVKEVRGSGLWVGVELHAEKMSARKVCEALRYNGILTKETHETVIRFAPPLIIDETTLDWALDIIKKTFLSFRT